MKILSTFKQKKPQEDLNPSPVIPSQEYKGDTRLPYIKAKNLDFDTNKYIEDLKSGQNNILVTQVAVRARPLNPKEVNISNFETIRILDDKVVVLLDPLNQFDANDVFRNNRNKEKQYAFDFAFDQTVNTETVFENTTKFLIPGVLNGFNATVFAYGATGAGKTYTMLGGNKPGVMFLTVNELFKQIHNNTEQKQFVVKVSYLEVYNETLRDLLSTEDRVIDLREEPAKGVIITGITEVTTSNVAEVMDMLAIGSKNRIMEPTGANVVSSRSHAVLQVTVEHRDKNQGINEEISISKLSLIDLAGSERASNTNNTGQRMIEGANINKSLLALGNCITLLSEKNEKALKNVHIPYRDSKLTRLLKDSLGGNCRTVMIANISPAVTAFEDTHNTLKYANRAKNIKTSVSRNVLNVENHVEKYTQIISDLRQENDQLKRLLHNGATKGFPELTPIKEADPEQKQTLLNEIKQHFETEMQAKKKVFDSEIQSDEVEEKIIGLQNDPRVSEDKALKVKYEDLINTKKRLALQNDEAKREYHQLSAKRNIIQSKIQKEKNKDTIALLQSIFKQNQMIIVMNANSSFSFFQENLELQHKEKRVENQMRLKDKELKYLQNQLAKIDGKTPESSYRQPLATPSRSNQNSARLNDEATLQNELYENSISFLTDNNNNDRDNSARGPNIKIFDQAKQALHLPHINPKVMYVSPSQASKKVIPTTRRLKDADSYDGPYQIFPNSAQTRQQPQQQQFYYNKQEFMLEKTKPFEVNQKERSNSKKKKPYISFQTKLKNEILTINSRRESSHDKNPANQARVRDEREYMYGISNGQNVKSLTDLSHVSTASSTIPHDRKQNNRMLSKSKVANRYTSVATRYERSPYIRNFKPKRN